MLGKSERTAIRALWERKLDHESRRLPQSERHRNLEPPSAEFLSALATGLGSKRMNWRVQRHFNYWVSDVGARHWRKRDLN